MIRSVASADKSSRVTSSSSRELPRVHRSAITRPSGRRDIFQPGRDGKRASRPFVGDEPDA